MGQCPYCEADLVIPDQGEWMTCQVCGNTLDVRAQQAFARAHAAFLDAEAIAVERRVREPGRGGYRAKARPDSAPLHPSLVHAYQQAYFGLSAALHGSLSSGQQLSGVTMMAEITRRLAPRAMASPLEAEYWTRLAIELTAQDELAALEERVGAARERLRVGHLVRRLRWRLRRRRLARALVKLRRQTEELERAIGFLEPPRIDRRAR